MHKKNRKLTMNIKNKLEYLRGRIQAERIGTGKIMELQSLAGMNIKNRLEHLRGRIQAERISLGEIIELQSLADHIEPDDVLLAEWAGIPEEVFAQKR